jgi:hypothetical protein
METTRLAPIAVDEAKCVRSALKRRAALALLASISCALALDSSAQGAPCDARPDAVPSAAGPAYPLKASANNRYLVDRDGRPFLIAGDAPQSLIGNLSLAEAITYLENRRAHGINALWINLLCNSSSACRADGSTFDRIPPFGVPGDLSTPNPDYFQRADDMICLAATYGMVVILDPIETIGWLKILEANGVAKAFEYGRYLGSRYRDFPNLIWMHGCDFQSWRNPAHRALVQAVARGIRSTDPNHPHTVELNFLSSGSLDDPSWAPLIELNAAYTYYPTYAQVLKEYDRNDFKPVFLVEANYEFERNARTDGGSTQNLRRQAYWTALSGATGQLYGSFYSWRFARGWQAHLDTPGITQFAYMHRLFAARKWYELVPDQTHTVVTDGRGQFSATGSITTDTYSTAARTSDGSLVMAYLPTIRTISLDMSKLAGIATARWFDPTNGTYAAIDGSPFMNSGGRQFAPPGKNSAGDGDWVLVVETSARVE